jgi:hypothetical protein
VFLLELRDGQSIDLADWRQTEFAEHFGELAALTRSVPTADDVGLGRYCPSYILNFIEQHRF